VDGDMRFGSFLLVLLVPVLLAGRVVAHCPLCTIGAGAAAGAAVWLGISKVAVALFLGGFAMSMGMWFSRMIKKKYIPFQKFVIIVGIFLVTLFPLLPLFSAIGPIYLSFVGEYGATFAVNYSFFSGLLGGGIVFVTPVANRKITKLRKGKHIPYQGIMLDFWILRILLRRLMK
jgi:hypothetical protein